MIKKLAEPGLGHWEKLETELRFSPWNPSSGKSRAAGANKHWTPQLHPTTGHIAGPTCSWRLGVTANSVIVSKMASLHSRLLTSLFKIWGWRAQKGDEIFLTG